MNRLIRTLASLRARFFDCPACGHSLLIRIGNDEVKVRCIRCRGTPVHLSIVEAVRHFAPDPATKVACELSIRGALARFLKRHFARVETSEFFDDLPTGTARDGVRCENVMALTYADNSFDLSTSTEVFEHVADDIAGFRELRRTLKPGGTLIFTVPLDENTHTVERARLEAGRITHLLPPTYHGDRVRGRSKVLVFRDYGRDIVEKLELAGFSRSLLWKPANQYFGHARTVVVAFP